MIAYRSAVHETTWTKPHMLMLGREVATPLDIVYEILPSMKRISKNKWVWGLQEKLEDAHCKKIDERQYTEAENVPW